MIVGYEELRVVLSPVVPAAGEPAPAGPRDWAFEIVGSPVPGFRNRTGRLRSALLARELARLRSESFTASTALLRDLGRKVWLSVMGPDDQPNAIGAAFEAIITVVDGQHKGLRLVFEIKGTDNSAPAPNDPVSFVDLPIELLRRPETSPHVRFLAADLRTPISRAPSDLTPVAPLVYSGPLRVLALVADPNADLTPIQADAERKAIKDALAEPIARGEVLLEFCEPPTLGALRERILGDRWHVFHFAGHGGVDELQLPFVAFVDESTADRPPLQRKANPVPPDVLGINLAPGGDLRMVVLTSCASARQPGALPAPDEENRLKQRLTRGFDSVAYELMRQTATAAVVAMQFDLETTAAAPFSKALYKGLTADLPLDVVLTEARVALMGLTNFGEGHRAWANPSLLWNCEGGVLFRKSCLLDDTARDEINDDSTQFQTLRGTLEGLYRQMEDFGLEIRQRLDGFKNEQKRRISEVLTHQALLLGNAVSLEPATGQAGKTVECRLLARLREEAEVKLLNVTLRIAGDRFRFQGYAPPGDLPTTARVNPRMVGDVLEVLYVDQANRPKPWQAGKIVDLGRLQLAIGAQVPPGVYDLNFLPEAAKIDAEKNLCVNTVNGIVFIDFPET